jgi:hypothetical protein
VCVSVCVCVCVCVCECVCVCVCLLTVFRTEKTTCNWNHLYDLPSKTTSTLLIPQCLVYCHSDL